MEGKSLGVEKRSLKILGLFMYDVISSIDLVWIYGKFVLKKEYYSLPLKYNKMLFFFNSHTFEMKKGKNTQMATLLYFEGRL